MWDDFFTHPDAQIYGADIVKKGGIDENRIIQADQGNYNDLLKLQQKGPWNVVVDDGSHLPEHQVRATPNPNPNPNPDPHPDPNPTPPLGDAGGERSQVRGQLLDAPARLPG